MDKFESLKRICYVGVEREHMAAPFVVDVGGQPWTAATDGCMLLAFAGVVGAATALPAGHAKMAVAIGELIAGAARAEDAFKMAALRKVAGEAQFDRGETCSTCSGSGKACTCGECECEDCCGGVVYHTVLPRKGFVLNRLCDLNRVACLLQGLTGAARIDVGDDPRSPLRFAGDGWCAVLMPVNAYGETDADLASFPRWGGGRS